MEENQEENKKLTFDEVLQDKEYQGEFDRKITKALETAKIKWEEEQQAKIEAEKTEAEKLAGMKEKEKYEYELKKRDEEIAKYKAKENARQLYAEALKIATTKGTEFDVKLLSLIDFEKETAETINEKTKMLKETFDEAVEKARNEYNKEPAPTQKIGAPEEKPKIREIF